MAPALVTTIAGFKVTFILPGVGGVHDADDFTSCSVNVTTKGYLNMQAFILGRRHFNNMTGMNFSALFVDSCSSVQRTAEVLSNIIQNDLLHLVDIWEKNHTIPLRNVLLIIGDDLSSVTLLLHNRLNHLNIPHISTGSTSHWLDNINRYPKLLRSTKSNTQSVPLVLQTCKDLNVTAVVLLYSNTPYGKSAAEIFRSSAAAYHVCAQEEIVLEENSTAIEQVGHRLATERSFPRVSILFADEPISKILVNAIASKDVLWTETGRILITDSDLPSLLDCDHIFKFLGSMKVHTNLPNLESLSYDTYSFESTESFSNFWYAQFWQQYGQCYLSPERMSGMPLSFSLPFPKRCEETHDLTFSSKGNCNDISAVINSPTVKTTYYSWNIFANVISNIPKITVPTVLANRTVLFQKLIHDQLSVFDPLTHQGLSVTYSILNLNNFNDQSKPRYTETYKVLPTYSNDPTTPVTMLKVHDPIYYRHGEVDNFFQSSCSPLDCPCPFTPGQPVKRIPLADEADTSASNDANPKYTTLATFLGIFVALVCGLILYLLYKCFHQRFPSCVIMKGQEKNKYRRYKSKYW